VSARCHEADAAWVRKADMTMSGVDFGARADRTDARDAAARYANKRAKMWGLPVAAAKNDGTGLGAGTRSQHGQQGA
jgi:hypothetical protein